MINLHLINNKINLNNLMVQVRQDSILMHPSHKKERKNWLKCLTLKDSDSSVTMLNDENLINDIKNLNHDMKEDAN